MLRVSRVLVKRYRDYFFLEWAFLSCLSYRIVGLNQRLLDEKKTRNTIFTILLSAVPKGFLNDPGKGRKVWTWPWSALQALMSLKVHRFKEDSEGKWGNDDHESSEFCFVGRLGRSLAAI